MRFGLERNLFNLSLGNSLSAAIFFYQSFYLRFVCIQARTQDFPGEGGKII